MKRILFAAAALAAIGFNTSAMAAGSASADVTMSGTVDPTCTLAAPTASATTNATATPGAATSSVALTLADGTTAALNNAAFTLTYAGMCNYAHKVGIKATNGGLLNASAVANAPVGGTFVQMIGYDADLTWAGASTQGPKPVTSTSSAAGVTAEKTAINTTVAGSNSGDLVLTVAIASDANPVVAGAYSETLTLKIGATL